MSQALDPEIDIDEPEMSYFRERGVKELLLSMVKQSLQDLVDLGRGRKTSYDLREQQFSANWLKTETGKHCLSFIMPDVSPDAAVARIYADPEAVLNALKRNDAEDGGELRLRSYRMASGIDVSIEMDASAEDVCAPG